MHNFLSEPTFIVFAIACLVLVTNLLFLWGYSGAVRGRCKAPNNPEDTTTVAKGGKVHEIDPPEVARVLRAHKNAEANIYPFLFLALIFVLAGGPAMHARVLFGLFVAFRLLHSIVYLAAQQPWRTIFFALGGLTTGVLAVDIIMILARA